MAHIAEFKAPKGEFHNQLLGVKDFFRKVQLNNEFVAATRQRHKVKPNTHKVGQVNPTFPYLATKSQPKEK